MKKKIAIFLLVMLVAVFCFQVVQQVQAQGKKDCWCCGNTWDGHQYYFRCPCDSAHPTFGCSSM
jgi:hypothetical protein